MAMQGGGSWLFPLQNGAPPIGWHDASAYLVLPVLLVVSQYVSQKIISPPSSDPSQQSTQWILKFLPLMIGMSSMTGRNMLVPSHMMSSDRESLCGGSEGTKVSSLTCVPSMCMPSAQALTRR